MKSLKTILITLAALVAGVAAYAQDSATEVTKLFNEAVPMLQAKQYAKALPILEKAVETGLDIPEAAETVEQAKKYIPNCYFRIGLEKAQKGDFASAVTYLGKADELGQQYGDMQTSRNAKRAISQSYTALGGNAFNNKDYKTAAEIFAKGYSANPQDTNLALNLAMSYCEMKDYDNGIKVYDNIIALGNLHSKFAEAASKAKTAKGEYLLQKALDEIKSGQEETAYATLDSILASDPLNAAANMLKVQTATNAKEWDNVIAWGEQAAAAQTDPEQLSTVYFLMGAAYDSKDDNATAIANYQKVTEGNNVAAAKNRIEALKALEKAKAEAKK